MYVFCGVCATGYTLEAWMVPAGGVSIECSRCGHQFRAYRDEPLSPPPLGLSELPDETLVSPRPSAALTEPTGQPRPPPPLPLAHRRAARGRPREDGEALTEWPLVQQVVGGTLRRWFTSRGLDLIVWLDDAGGPRAFQLCYDKTTTERAVTFRDGRFFHAAVDGGERHTGLGYKRAPVLVSDVEFDARRIALLFERAARNLPPTIGRYVRSKLSERVAPGPTRRS